MEREAEVTCGEPAADRILVQRDYVIGYSDSLLVPQWTVHRLDSTGLDDVARADCFRRAPRVPAPTASLPSDYDEPVYDQGHLTPNGDMSRKLTPVLNSFVLSNMAPQHCQFNRGVWRIFESLVRIWAEEQGVLYVITGSVFDRDGDGVRDDDSITLRMTSRNGKTRVGGRPGEVVLVAGIESAQVEFAIDQVVQGMLEGAGMQLPFEIDGDEARAGVDLLVAGHGIGSNRDDPMTLDIPFGSQQNADMKRVFLQPRWASSITFGRK